MSFTAFIFDVITDTIYPARITVEDGLFKEVTPITINEGSKIDVKGLMIPGLIDAHNLLKLQCATVLPLPFATLMR